MKTETVTQDNNLRLQAVIFLLVAFVPVLLRIIKNIQLSHIDYINTEFSFWYNPSTWISRWYQRCYFGVYIWNRVRAD